MQILIIDNNIDADSWGANELCVLARVAPGATIHVRRAPAEDLPRDARAFDRIVISGSKTSALEEAPWISRLEKFILEAIHAEKPLLGVCYGHQILARALGGKSTVRKAESGEFGWVEVELLPEAGLSPLMEKLPRKFHTFGWHNDEVCELPPGTLSLARSKLCPIQAFQLKSQPVYGIQFHPERALEKGEESLRRKIKDNPQHPLINRNQGKKLYNAEVGLTLFRNFLAQGGRT
jgi:GMP synthase (glutamine-hydrolysing)